MLLHIYHFLSASLLTFCCDLSAPIIPLPLKLDHCFQVSCPHRFRCFLMQTCYRSLTIQPKMVRYGKSEVVTYNDHNACLDRGPVPNIHLVLFWTPPRGHLSYGVDYSSWKELAPRSRPGIYRHSMCFLLPRAMQRAIAVDHSKHFSSRPTSRVPGPRSILKTYFNVWQ